MLSGHDGNRATIPEAFARRMVRVYGEEGRAWIERLSSLLEELARTWNVEIGPPVANLTYNYVAPAKGVDGTQYVVKLGVGSFEGDREPLALNAYAGRGAVRLVHQDPSRRAMLLERIAPGNDLLRLTDEEAVTIAAEVLEGLWSAASTETFPSLAEWTGALERVSGPIPKSVLDQARGLRHDLLASSPENVLLHGDLHHTNVLRSGERGWLAIDPKGIIGEKAFDILWFLLNPGPVPPETTQRRIDGFVERLGLDRERIVAWAYVGAVVSACWTVEDRGTGWERAVGFAEEVRVKG